MNSETKIDIIMQGVTDIKVEIAKSIVYQEQLRKELDEEKKKIRDLEKTKTRPSDLFHWLVWE